MQLQVNADGAWNSFDFTLVAVSYMELLSWERSPLFQMREVFRLPMGRSQDLVMKPGDAESKEKVQSLRRH